MRKLIICMGFWKRDCWVCRHCPCDLRVISAPQIKDMLRDYQTLYAHLPTPTSSAAHSGSLHSMPSHRAGYVCPSRPSLLCGALWMTCHSDLAPFPHPVLPRPTDSTASSGSSGVACDVCATVVATPSQLLQHQVRLLPRPLMHR